jgi:hypothetical protein
MEETGTLEVIIEESILDDEAKCSWHGTTLNPAPTCTAGAEWIGIAPCGHAFFRCPPHYEEWPHLKTVRCGYGCGGSHLSAEIIWRKI